MSESRKPTRTRFWANYEEVIMTIIEQAAPTTNNFLRTIIEEDLKSGKHTGIVTRFPPEPNGYLHIGHAKSICLNFGLARDFQGRCHLRFDDTNPTKENVQWLGFDWGEHLHHASDYFEDFYRHAVTLIEKGLAFVDSLSAEEM